MFKLVISLGLLSILYCFGNDAIEINKSAKKYLQKRDFKTAIPLLQKAAKLNNAESQYNLGVSYENGIEVDQNMSEAIFWYVKSAEQNWNDALYRLMLIYANGNGVKKDLNQAFTYALRCAKQNDPTCMFNVVSSYKDGLGTNKDNAKMFEWAIKLGKLKNPPNLFKSGRITSARLNLAYMYRDGIETKRDIFTSYVWFLIYNEYKRDFSYLQQKSVIEEIKIIEREVTNLDQARKEAERILQRPLKNLSKLYIAEIYQG